MSESLQYRGPTEDQADTEELRARLEEARVQLERYERELQRVTESEKEARRQITKLQRGAEASSKPSAPSAGGAKPSVRLNGNSAAMRRVLKLCQEVAHTDASVILMGETGVGKEVAARTIHDSSLRRERPFVAVNCAALPETLLESELFGHEKGAFTGATNQKPGHFEMAEGGTLLLDEIGEMPMPMQAKLLRVLEQRCFLRVGGTQLIYCDVRIIAATNRDLQDEINAMRFRSDLYYRLNVFPIDLPPLRDRLEDFESLIDQISHGFSDRSGIEPPRVSDEAMAYMRRHPWPGNIRELRNVLERSIILARGRQIEPRDLPTEVITSRAEDNGDPTGEGSTVTSSKLATSEKQMILEALHVNGWNKAAAARQLGISWDNLRYRIKKYKLKKPV